MNPSFEICHLHNFNMRKNLYRNNNRSETRGEFWTTKHSYRTTTISGLANYWYVFPSLILVRNSQTLVNVFPGARQLNMEPYWKETVTSFCHNTLSNTHTDLCPHLRNFTK